jgi:hypothetical protein
MSPSEKTCLTCHGTGESVTEVGPQPCPDCFGVGRAQSPNTKLEWRLREIERSCAQLGRESATDVLWLIHELRVSRAALLEILTCCQDADETDLTARDVRFRANAALKLYDATEVSRPT